jgi:hypothetical protein
MRKTITAIVLAIAVLVGGASAVSADPDFGPGNSSKGPLDGGAKCHPPGQTVTEPGCK